MEREKLEIEKNKIIKILKGLMDQLQIDDKELQGFKIDNKVSVSKNDIMPIENDSNSESDEESESDTEEEIIPKKKTKQFIKIKGSIKPKLSLKNKSDSDSDE